VIIQHLRTLSPAIGPVIMMLMLVKLLFAWRYRHASMTAFATINRNGGTKHVAITNDPRRRRRGW